MKNNKQKKEERKMTKIINCEKHNKSILWEDVGGQLYCSDCLDNLLEQLRECVEENRDLTNRIQSYCRI